MPRGWLPTCASAWRSRAVPSLIPRSREPPSPIPQRALPVLDLPARSPPCRANLCRTAGLAFRGLCAALRCSLISPPTTLLRSIRAVISMAVLGWRCRGSCCRLWCGRRVRVVEVLVLVQRDHRVALIPDQGPVQQLSPAAADPPFHDRIHSRRSGP
jgi:hypothetical protein